MGSVWRSVGTVVRIHALRRFIGGGSKIVTQEELRVVDGVGLYVPIGHDGQTLTDDEIRSHLKGQEGLVYYVEAESVPAALAKFSQYEGCLAGTRSPAIRVDPSRPLVVYPICPRMFQNQRGTISCGNPSDSGSSHQGCILERFYPPDDCPIKEFLAQRSA